MNLFPRKELLRASTVLTLHYHLQITVSFPICSWTWIVLFRWINPVPIAMAKQSLCICGDPSQSCEHHFLDNVTTPSCRLALTGKSPCLCSNKCRGRDGVLTDSQVHIRHTAIVACPVSPDMRKCSQSLLQQATERTWSSICVFWES